LATVGSPAPLTLGAGFESMSFHALCHRLLDNHVLDVGRAEAMADAVSVVVGEVGGNYLLVEALVQLLPIEVLLDYQLP